MLNKNDFLFENKDIKKVYFVSKPKFGTYEVNVSGSKSYTNRALILAGMSPYETFVSGILFSEDSYYTLYCLAVLGFKIKTDKFNCTVKVSPPTKQVNHHFELHFGKAGTLARFFPAVILNWQKTFPNFLRISAQLNASQQLQKRPLKELIQSLQMLGAKASKQSLPLLLTSSDLSGKSQISGKVSGQFLSGLLLAGIGSQNKIKITRTENLVQPDYVKMTIQSIQKFGGEIEYDSSLTDFVCKKSRFLRTEHYKVEACASTACYFITLAYLHNFNLKIKNIGSTTLQPDHSFTNVLKQLGANIIVNEFETCVVKQQHFARPKGNLSFDFSKISDQALTIGVIALFADGPIEVFNISHIRHHECNRIQCFTNNLKQLNVRCVEKEDGFIVYPLNDNQEIFGDWHTHQDHRFALSGFILASLINSITVLNPACVEKTAPTFLTQMQNLDFKIKFG